MLIRGGILMVLSGFCECTDMPGRGSPDHRSFLGGVLRLGIVIAEGLLPRCGERREFVRRNGLMLAKKVCTVVLTAALVMSQGALAFAEATTETVTVDASEGNKEAKHESVKVEASDNTVAGVEAGSSQGHTATVDITGDATGEVSGDVSVKNGGAGEAFGIDANSVGEASKTDVAVDGKVSVESGGNATGIAANASDGGSVEVETGDLSVKSEKGQATGANIVESGTDSRVDISVIGDIDASGKYSFGVNGFDLPAASSTSVFVNGDVTATGNGSEDSTAEGVQITTAGYAWTAVNGDVTADTTGIIVGDTISKYNEETNEWEEYSSDSAYISVNVAGDVTAAGTAIDLTKNADGSIMNVTVGGTVKGEEHNIVLSDEVKTDGLDITVWKIDTSGTNGRTVEKRDEEKGETIYEDYSGKAADIINYIIKIDENSIENLYSERPYAKEGETVYLKVDVPDGYSIDSFYNGQGANKVEVIKDDNGYYLVVPRGGGVCVGVTLKSGSSGGEVNPTPTPAPNPSSDSGSDSDSSSGSDDNRSTPASGTGSGSPAGNELPGRVSVAQSVMVNGQAVSAAVSVSAADMAMEQAFTDMLGVFSVTGMVDLSGNAVQVPAGTVVKDSFTFAVGDMTGLVTTFIELNGYKEGDIIMCSYVDAMGNPVIIAITPDMINGTSLLLTLPANCTLALAGSAV